MATELERLQAALPKRYRILRQLDGAGMSRVYLAREELPERDVAIKVFDEDLSARLGRERFVREVELTSKLSHPHIVPIYAAGDAGGTLYYVMPYIDGESLRDRMAREGQLPIADALRIAQQIADALQHAHDRGVVHRDIKPSNILLQSGFAVIADFGIARALSAADQRDGLTRGDTPIGTPDYMSPEQASGTHRVDGRTDEYGLACVVYEMLTGQPPFHSRTPQATLARHLTEPVPSLRVLRDTVPEQVDICVRRALSKAPVDRFGSVADFARALDGAPRAAENSWIVRRGIKPGWSPLGASLRVAGVMLAVAAVGVAWHAWFGTPQAASTEGIYRDSVAVMPFENRTGDPAFDRLGKSMADEVINHLATVPEVKVISTYSVESLWESHLGIPRLLDTLNVGHLIEGYYVLRGGRVAVVVSELDASGAVRHPTTRELDPAGLDTMQTRVAHAIATAYLGHQGIAAPDLDRPDVNPGPARNAHLNGTLWLGQRTPDGFKRAIASFRDAIAYDSGYAEARAGLSSAYALALYYKYDVGISGYGLAAMALSSANRAIALDPAMSSGYSARGYIRAMLGMDTAAAASDFARALDLAPNRPDGPSWSARILAMRGQADSAFAEATRARDLDPLQAGRRMAVATLALQLRNYPVAITEAREAHRLEPSLWLARAVEGRALALTGQGAECLSLDFGVYAAVQAICLHALGRDEEARDSIAALEARVAEPSAVNPGFLNELVMEDLASYYGFVGDADRAANWLRRAFDLSPNGVDTRVLGSGLFDPVRHAPVFETAVRDAHELARARVRAEEQALEGPMSLGNP